MPQENKADTTATETENYSGTSSTPQASRLETLTSDIATQIAFVRKTMRSLSHLDNKLSMLLQEVESVRLEVLSLETESPG